MPKGTQGALKVAASISIVPLDEKGPQGAGMAAACLPLLPGPLQLRARAMADQRARSRFVLCHWAVLWLARQAAGGAPVTYMHESSGRPVLIPGPWLSISRAAGHAAIGLSSTEQIGLDLASISAEAPWRSAQGYPGLAARIPSGATGRLPFLKAWTELEAIAKLRQIPMQQLLVSPAPQACHLASFEGQGLILTLATERASTVSIAWMGWTAEAGLEVSHSQSFSPSGMSRGDKGPMQPWP
ncbi:MAG: hypothetical protein IOC86_16470 [Aestuariivirga sp.]|nr:hypothetical protein [Aestuariivirga sp.]